MTTDNDVYRDEGMTLDRAIDIMARQILADKDEKAWECYPGIGEFDWDRILAKVDELAPYPDQAEVSDAYNFFLERARDCG